MSATERSNRYGRTAERNTEPPATLAAARNGASGRQQLAAAKRLTSAPALANSVLPVVSVCFSGTPHLAF
jgi:hypothetical protein